MVVADIPGIQKPIAKGSLPWNEGTNTQHLVDRVWMFGVLGLLKVL